MFTGIIRAQGSLVSVAPRGTGRELIVAGIPADWGLEIGASVALDGICLTVEAFLDNGVQLYVSDETLTRTTAGDWAAGRSVHLEPALRAGDAMGGHVVQGHVDGVGSVVRREPRGEDLRLAIRVPAELLGAMVSKGSIAIDGVSLTINAREDDVMELNLIPHTLAETHLGGLEPGAWVNVEADPIAKQVAELLPRLLAEGGRP